MQGKQSSDIVEYFPVEVSIEIFSYLKAKDLCSASLVSTAWYDLIADSQECMKNIKINVKCNIERSTSLEMVSLLLESTRKYENLELSRCHECVQDVSGLFFTMSKEWKQVKMTKTTFKDVNQALDFLECIEKTVEVLELNDVTMMDDYSNRCRRGFTFPKLKVFRAVYIQKRLFHEAFDRMENLQHFELCTTGQTVASLQGIMRILTTNKKLRVWEVSCSIFNLIFFQKDFDQLKFKLERLYVSSYAENNSYFDTVKANFATFLRSHGGNIKTLTLGHWMGMNVLEAMLELKQLEDFTINGYSKTVYRDIEQHINLKLPTNNSLLRLTLINAPNDIEFMKKMTAAVPNLTCFSIPLMEEPLMQHMSSIHKNLQCLTVGTFTASEVSSHDFFKSLKHVSINSYKTILINKIRSKSLENRSSFEILLEELFKTQHKL